MKITRAIIAVNVAVFLLMLCVDGLGGLREFSTHALLMFGADYAPLVRHLHHVHRLVTSTFIHIDAVHLLMNMVALHQIGAVLEPHYGPRRFTVLYLVAGVAGSLVSLALHWRAEVVSAGASGAICGLIGAGAVVGHHGGTPRSEAFRNAMLRWALMVFGYGIVIHADNAAHAGGLVAGAALAWQLRDAPVRRARWAWLVPLACAAAVAASFAQAVRTRADAYTEDELVNLGVKAARPEDAIVFYRRALALDPNDEIAWHDLAIAYDKLGEFDQAIAAAKKARELDDADANKVLSSAYVNQGVSLSKAGKIDDAIAAYQRAIDVDPKDAIAWYDLGLAQGKNGDADGAITSLRSAHQLEPSKDHAEALLRKLTTRGIAHSKAGREALAIVDYREALTLDPKDEVVLYDLGVSLEREGDLDAAARALRAAIAVKRTRLAYLALADVLRKKHDGPAADEAQDTAATLPKDDDDVDDP